MSGVILDNITFVLIIVVLLLYLVQRRTLNNASVDIEKLERRLMLNDLEKSTNSKTERDNNTVVSDLDAKLKDALDIIHIMDKKIQQCNESKIPNNLLIDKSNLKNNTKKLKGLEGVR